MTIVIRGSNDQRTTYMPKQLYAQARRYAKDNNETYHDHYVVFDERNSRTTLHVITREFKNGEWVKHDNSIAL